MARVTKMRMIVLTLLGLIFCAVVIGLLTHPQAEHLLRNPHELGQEVRRWTQTHALEAEILLVSLYVLLTLVAMPIWWLNILAGYSFGLIGGTIRCVIAAAVAASITAMLWRFLAADLADHKLFPRFKILNLLHRYAKDGAFLVVFLTRMAHLLPFGLSNYLFGTLGIGPASVFSGTLLGVIPSTAIYVSLGSGRDWRSHPIFIVTIGIMGIAGLVMGIVIYARHHATEEKPPKAGASNAKGDSPHE